MLFRSVLMNWTCNVTVYNIFVLVDTMFELCMHICIYVLVRFEFSNLIFFAGKCTVGSVLDLTAPTNANYRGGWCYILICRGGWWFCRGGW